MKINFPLLALAIGAFGIGTTEFSPMGLLPVIARGVDVSIPAAGMLISAYAIGVMVGAPLMTLLLSHRARRNALIFLMAIFTLGNVLSAISPDYTTLMLSRILTSLNHGAFFGLGSVVAASVVPKHKQASAVATMFMGLTIANIGGVPAATFAVVPPLQMRVMRVAHEAPGLSSSVNIGAFNLGNALGAAAGGAVISGGLGYSFVPVMGAIIAALGLLLVMMSGRKQPEAACAAE
ncbi:MFS transporter [Enterobacter cloacae complex sp. OE43NF]|uniref:MFS transporter n=1 Tax=Enterobacter cloacae complex TaxID=354276 RepID=UPI0020224916|nr:MFS transporter [Enterobacter cloacae complex sp. OE43NF]MCL7668181.1 MFS transporter [Enterobacter cloacae complex sp. OE43NF]